MKRLAMASVLSLAATVLVSPASRASGFIVVDPAFHPPVHPIVRPPAVHPPGHPIAPPPSHTMLHGSVSFGLRLADEDIKVEINDQVAKTYITQTFMNDSDQNLAGTYLFPLPDDTTFSSFSLHIDGKPVEGKILEAQEARTQYETIVRQMVDPGLLEYADYKTVRCRIFPIPAHGSKKVEFEYTQVLRGENGLLKYDFPLKSKGESGAIDQVKVNVKLASKQGVRTIWSPTHTISAERPDNQHARISMLSHDTIPDKDFLLYYSVSNKDMSANLLTHKAPAEDGYFMLTLSPPVKGAQILDKDVVLTLDTSGSMNGEKLQQAKKALRYIVNALGPQDRFSIVQFNTDVEVFKYHIVSATPENKKAALSWIDDLEARGGTNIGGALQMGSSLLSEQSTRPAYIVMMTDGEPTVGETDPASLLKSFAPKRDIRLFDFGVGYDVNTKLLNKLADNHHGTSQYVEPNENLETALSAFYEKIKSPVLSNVHIDYSGINVKDIYPREVKDVFAGSQVLLIGKYKGSGSASVHVTGSVNGVAKSYNFPLKFENEDADHTYLPRLWAMRRIGHLTDVAQENGNNREVVDEIVGLSKKYGIISQYTSYLVTDPSENHRMPVRTFIPGDHPRGGTPGMAAGGAGGHGFAAAMPMSAPVPALNREATSTRGSLMRSNMQPSAVQIIDARGADFMAQPSVVMDRHYSLAVPAGINAFTGAQAVKKAKTMSSLKQSSVVADGDEESSGVRTVADKTFYSRDGVWTESDAQDQKTLKVEVIEFGSTKYFDLIKNVPGISKYLSVGEQVMFIYKGHCYKIIKGTSNVG